MICTSLLLTDPILKATVSLEVLTEWHECVHGGRNKVASAKVLKGRISAVLQVNLNRH